MTHMHFLIFTLIKQGSIVFSEHAQNKTNPVNSYGPIILSFHIPSGTARSNSSNSLLASDKEDII